MSSTVRDRKHPFRLPSEDARAVDELVAQTKVSFSRIVSLCVRKGLPWVRADLSSKSGRVTNVDPLPEKVLRRIYSRPERDEGGVDRLVKAQAKGVRD
ncbi:MAG: hypothetical protein HY298_03900 [Verrucomicrobia bacterium]|nr:hypothetical protein [Verrucomicrobiota bacterium]